MRILAITLLSLTCFAAAEMAEGSTSIEDFVAHPKYRSVKISPDGNHLAVIAPVGGVNHLVFLNISNPDQPQQTGVLSPPPMEEVANVSWVSDERVILQTSIVEGTLELPRLTGRIIAVNLDGKKDRSIWSIEKNRAVATVLDTIDDDDNHIIVSHYGANRSKPIVERVNVFSGRTSRIGISPLNRGGVLLDADQKIRFAVGRNDDLTVQAAYRPKPDGPWTTFDSPLGGDTLPVGFGDGGKNVYLVSDGPGEMGVHRLNLESEEVTPVAIHDRVEADRMIWSRDGNDLIGVGFMPGLPEVRLIKEDHEDAALFESLMAAFEGSQVAITSLTRDKNTAIVQVTSDRQPATWYLFDIDDSKLRFLVGSRPAIDAEQMAPTESHWIVARDGLEYQLYVTKPTNAGDGPYPAIVYVHGGPYGPRDRWEYDAETQMLASHGYAVIRPNFRGSGGFGSDFEKGAYQQWYGEMQDDVTDATLWAIEARIADESRICIYGGSYGGYATLAGLTKEPDLYACGFSFVGVYDLELLHKVGDITERKAGRNFLKAAVGTDAEELKARSPINHVANIKAPLYIAHGKEDVRAHVEHFYQLKKRLDSENIPYTDLLVRKEGHGFYKLENRVHYANELLGFFDRHIGTKAKTGPSTR